MADALSNLLSFSGPYRAQLLLAAPKTLQAVIAALGDYYTWRLAEAIYGIRSLAPAAALVLTVASPWQWFCSTRTFSNSLETTLTVIALYNWPWHWSEHRRSNDDLDPQGLRKRKAVTTSHGATDELTRLRRALLCAALATVLRPTNILIWTALTSITLLQSFRGTQTTRVSSEPKPPAQTKAFISQAELLTFLRETLLCGSVVLSLSAGVDRLFYGIWTFPAWNFLRINVFESIAVFYGNNNWHYYISQGFPLLLTTALPFALLGMYRALSSSDVNRNMPQTSRNALSSLTIISIFVPVVLSVISHKEVRFIYPLLPGLHILAARPTSTYFASAFDRLRPYSKSSQLFKRILLATLLALKLSVSLYTATMHNSGLVQVTHYLRSEFETYHIPSPVQHNMTVGFLMPCHSTPWRSHLQNPPTSSYHGIDAWALTCEPPLNMDALARANYLDEADHFYIEPGDWLKRHMSRSPPSPKFPTIGNHEPGVFAPAKPRRMFEIETRDEEILWRERKGRRPWPEYLVFFGQLEPQMKMLVGRGSGYTECNRIWNSHAHDDWRRSGDVVVWCLYPERKVGVDVQATKKAEYEKAKEAVRLAGSGAERSFWKQKPLMVKQEESLLEKTKSWLGLTKRKGWFDGWFGGRGRAGHWD